MVDETSSRDGVSHAGCLERLGALDEELQVAVNALVVQVEAVCQTVSADLDGLLIAIAKFNLLRRSRNLEILSLVSPAGWSLASLVAHAVLQQSHAALDNRFLGIVPLVGIVAHQEAAVWVQVNP